MKIGNVVDKNAMRVMMHPKSIKIKKSNMQINKRTVANNSSISGAITKFSIYSFIAAAAIFHFSPNATAATCAYPSQVLNLANWKETLPIGSSGSPTEILQASLSSYSQNPYFMPNSTCNGVVFRAPVNGVTTSGSGYPRSELREMTNNGQSNASWSTTSGTHSMFIDEAITAVPQTKKHVVAGQIHDANDDVIVIRLEFPKLFVDINGVTGPTLDANYTLGKRFTVQFVSTNGQIKIYYNGKQTPAYTMSKSGSGNYFKAGAYTQSNCTKESVCAGTNFGEVNIYNLKVEHQGATSAPILISAPGTSPVVVPIPTPVPTPIPVPAPVPTPVPAPVVSGLTFEAESAAITSPMQIASDSAASGGKYIVQTTDTGTGSSKFTFTVPSDGKYQLRTKVISPDGSSNSFNYALDSNALNAWHLPDTLKSWTWVDGAVVTLSKGTHTLTISKREKNTKIDSFQLQPVVVTTVSDSSTPLEAESGIISGGMSVLTDDSSASGGKYVRADSAGSISYNVNVPTAGKYKVAGWIKAANGSSDSFYVSVDTNSAVTWALQSPSVSWIYDVDDSHTFSLGAGTHTITLRYREAGAKIDKLVLVKQ